MWIVEIPDRAAFGADIEEQYDNDSAVTPFAKACGIQFYDHEFQEVVWHPRVPPVPARIAG